MLSFAAEFLQPILPDQKEDSQPQTLLTDTTVDYALFLHVRYSLIVFMFFFYYKITCVLAGVFGVDGSESASVL